MKTKFALGAIAMSLSIASFASPVNKKNPAAEETGKKIFTAFQHAAYMEYNSLVPTLNELYQLMDANASFYGSNLEEAKAALSKQYAGDVKRIETSFISAIEQSKLNHISWDKAKFISADRSNNNLTIEFTVNGQPHKVQVSVTEIEGELHAGNVICCI